MQAGTRDVETSEVTGLGPAGRRGQGPPREPPASLQLTAGFLFALGSLH